MIINNNPTPLLFKSNLNSVSICLARPYIIWHWFTSMKHDFDSCVFHFCFYLFRFNYNERVLCICRLCCYLLSFGLLLDLLTMRPFLCTYTHLLVFVWLSFALIDSLSHTSIWTPIPMMCNNLLLYFWLLCLGSF